MSVSSLASFEYLERLPGTTFQRLYLQPSTSLAIFRRMLPHLAKSFVMALLYMTKPLPLTDLDLWVQPNPNSRRLKESALATLSRLHIVMITRATREEPQVISLAKNFRSSLRLALTGGGDHNSFGVPSSDIVEDVSLGFLDQYAREQWEGILHYVVNSVADGMRSEGRGPTSAVKDLLEAGKLVTKGRSAAGITKDGFSFLLQEVNAQVWTLLLLWIENAEKMQMDSVEVLSFLFTLGSLELGRAYSTSTLSEAQLRMTGNLVDFGLIYIPESSLSEFFPTRLATTLTSDASALRSVAAGFEAASTAASGSKGFIIIETNYRLYAYTSSPLQIAVLALFTKLNTRYPNMVSGKITRASISQAIAHGITSDQIITYLSTHAHPQLQKTSAAQGGGPVLPPTVVDQIRLWQFENERMKTTPGFLFKEFESQKEYDACVKYAEDLGELCWRSDSKRMFFVRKHEQLAAFIKSRRVK